MKKCLYLLLFIPVLWLGGSYAGSIFSTRSNPVAIGNGASYFEQTLEEIQLISKDKKKISAWFIAVLNSKKAVVLMNGLRGNRLGMVSRAKIYLDNGYSVLLPDLRGTGKSEDCLVTFGWKERWDLLAAYDYLKQAQYSDIAVHGMSLGAATIVYSLQENPDYQFVVLESCYDNIDQALANRVERFHIPLFVFEPLNFFTEWRIDAETEQLSPENYMHLCKAPTFILAGDHEIRVRKSETEKLYNNCIANNKQLHFFKGAKHEDFMNRYHEEFTSQLENWLKQF